MLFLVWLKKNLKIKKACIGKLITCTPSNILLVFLGHPAAPLGMDGALCRSFIFFCCYFRNILFKGILYLWPITKIVGWLLISTCHVSLWRGPNNTSLSVQLIGLGTLFHLSVKHFIHICHIFRHKFLGTPLILFFVIFHSCYLKCAFALV